MEEKNRLTISSTIQVQLENKSKKSHSNRLHSTFSSVIRISSFRERCLDFSLKLVTSAQNAVKNGAFDWKLNSFYTFEEDAKKKNLLRFNKKQFASCWKECSNRFFLSSYFTPWTFCKWFRTLFVFSGLPLQMLCSLRPCNSMIWYCQRIGANALSFRQCADFSLAWWWWSRCLLVFPMCSGIALDRRRSTVNWTQSRRRTRPKCFRW